MSISHLIIDSPIGDLLLTADGGALTALDMEPLPERPKTPAGNPVLTAARKQLERYFAGRLMQFDLPLAPAGSPFAQQVWLELQQIPFGQTVTYADLAQLVGRPGHFRAVGSANGRNPISIIVPCHRVVGSNGSLTGYSGGVERKRWLLDHESESRPD
ncbi:MAG: methylated-DNA-[protein]-cysteine S-methyltransferase [Gaiellales bacterium]|jgi:methylated-DNA-[protein]-cysteine S-methyltransferase|nr:methylated-DNA-[protein]-cysteine S-methyltransferase [Gaiellales bacterium]